MLVGTICYDVEIKTWKYKTEGTGQQVGHSFLLLFTYNIV